VDDNEDVEDKFEDPKCVGEIGSGFCSVEELEHAIDLKETVQTKNNWTRNHLISTIKTCHEVKQVRRNQCNQIHFEMPRSKVIEDEFV